MILVDTVVWIDHFRKENTHLSDLLTQGRVTTHPFVIGELACGHFQERKNIFLWLSALPVAELVDHTEVLYFIEERQLMGLGIGIVDVHLLASATLSNIPLWTLDKRLIKAAQELDADYRTM